MTVPLPVIYGENIAGHHSVRRRVRHADRRFKVQAVLAEWKGL